MKGGDSLTDRESGELEDKESDRGEGNIYDGRVAEEGGNRGREKVVMGSGCQISHEPVEAGERACLLSVRPFCRLSALA